MSKIINLYEAKKNGVFQVTSVPDIGLLENLGLRNGTKVVVESRYALGGPVLLRIENTFAVAIGKDIATQIAVKEVVRQ
ncbi:MAG: ferrous iron transport protein A [Defluviitaleaceae bacterium]|nr:ferrous iron transport protein A [Defluviitaleaceae bacterium]